MRVFVCSQTILTRVLNSGECDIDWEYDIYFLLKVHAECVYNMTNRLFVCVCVCVCMYVCVYGWVGRSKFQVQHRINMVNVTQISSI